MNILFIDTETTGTDPSKHALLQVSAVLFSDGKNVALFNEQIKHDFAEVDLGALRVNRVKLGQIQSYGNDQRTVMTRLVDFLLELRERHTDIIVCGHNVNFDVQFLSAALKQIGVSNLSAVLPFRVMDTASIGLFLNSTGKLNTRGKYSLSELMKALDIKEPERRHDSLVDALCTAEVFYALQKLLGNAQ